MNEDVLKALEMILSKIPATLLTSAPGVIASKRAMA